MPVYRGYDDTLACLHAVLASANATQFEVVVINDASPEPRLVIALEAIAALGLIDLVHNADNRGFVHSATTGLMRHPQRDVILLNADTVVHGDWIDRLLAHRLGHQKIGTITPWSNNATILSYPFACENNDFDLEVDFGELDDLAGGVLAGAACDIPTGVGFCLYVGRDCINEIGTFDVEAFGRGYGEENDFCLRAAARGWRNIAACDVFVRHTGEVSFGEGAVAARRLAAAVLLKRHPGYGDLITAFIAADPLLARRQKLDLARLARWGEGRILLVFGSAAGGTRLSPHREPAFPTARDLRLVCVRPSQDDPQSLAFDPIAGLVLPNLPRLPIGDLAAALGLLAECGVVEARIDGLAGYGPEQSRFAGEVCARLGK